MQAVFTYKLEDDELRNIYEFCESAESYSIEQYPDWKELFPDTKFCYFYLYDESGIKSYSQIIESHRLAQINYGPVCSDKDNMVDSISEIIEYYRKKHFLFLGIQLYFKTGYDTDYIEYKLNKKYKIKYIFDNSNTKSSIEIDLENDIDDIFRNFSKGHKSDVKKANKLGITTETINNLSDLNVFNGIYTKMCEARNIDRGELRSDAIFKLYDLLKSKNKGKILIAKDKYQRIVGGAILVAQGNTLRYFKGATDLEMRNLPITHLLIYDAIKLAKIEGFRYFDFWGINHFADKEEQIYNVNHFKKGFGGYYTFFAKKMNINLIPYGYSIYKIALNLKNILNMLRLLKKPV